MHLRALLVRAAMALAVSAIGVTAWVQPASADLVDPSGSCVVTATWTRGGFTLDSTTARPGTVIDVPRADEVAWTARVVGPSPNAGRQTSGTLALDLPAPLGSVTIDRWSGSTTTVTNSGSRSYHLAALVPAGVVFKVRGEHHENGRVFCTGTALLRIAGEPLSSPLTWISLALTALFGVLLLLTGRSATPGLGHLALGAGLGLPFGALIGLTLVLFGVSTLGGPLPLVFALAGMAGGAAWSRLSPLRRLRRPA